MLAEKFFSHSDTSRIETNHRKYKKITFLSVFILAPAQILIAYLASKKVPELFWPISLFGLTIVGLSYFLVFKKGLESFKKEQSEQVKLAGELQVVTKSEKKDQRIIGFNSTEVDSIIVPQNVYEKINIGDTLSIEISKYTKWTFKLSRDGQNLINNS